MVQIRNGEWNFFKRYKEFQDKEVKRQHLHKKPSASGCEVVSGGCETLIFED